LARRTLINNYELIIVNIKLFIYFNVSLKTNKMNLPPMEPAKLQITPDQMDSICCDACGHEYFKQVLILKKISKLYTGTTKDRVVTMPAFVCDACGEPIDMEKLS
jgi:hypothetical protein